MIKDLFIEFEKCTGCRICEIACSLYQKGVCSPIKSAIRIIKWEKEGVDVPIVCQQCESPLCAAVCPSDAIFRDLRTGAMLVNEERCVGCRMCIAICPFGAASLDPDTGKMIKCNLCEGNPACIKYCEPKAIQYLPADRAVYFKKKV
ncbi:MAG: 4Fe-4S dicluster domain-containing protein, partial [Deltaproteobacteria bacterium]|nr:4Fe-4S dicluster domain-containing protein [Deltaproteobacteria bacterium]